MAEPTDMLLGMVSCVGQRNHVLDGGADPPREGAIFGGKQRSLQQCIGMTCQVALANCRLALNA